MGTWQVSAAIIAHHGRGVRGMPLDFVHFKVFGNGQIPSPMTDITTILGYLGQWVGAVPAIGEATYVPSWASGRFAPGDTDYMDGPQAPKRRADYVGYTYPGIKRCDSVGTWGTTIILHGNDGFNDVVSQSLLR